MNHPIGHEAAGVRKIRVKIISSGKPTFWYAQKIGKAYDVLANVVEEDRSLDGSDYVLEDEYIRGDELLHMLKPSDCEIIS